MKNILCSARALTSCFVLASTFAIACSSTAPGEGTAFADESSATAADGGVDAGDTDAGTDDGKLCGPIIPNGRCATGFVCQRDGVDTGHCTAEGRACGPDAVPRECPAGYTCAWKPGDIDVGHCTKDL